MTPVEKVTYWYYRFFRRDPDPGGQNYWSNRLVQGEDPTKVLSEFLAYDEYWLAAGDSAQAFVRQLACDLHNHLPNTDDMAVLARDLASNAISRQEVAAEMILHA